MAFLASLLPQTVLLIPGAPGSLSYFSLEKLRADTVPYKMTDPKETLENRGTHVSHLLRQFYSTECVLQTFSA